LKDINFRKVSITISALVYTTVLIKVRFVKVPMRKIEGKGGNLEKRRKIVKEAVS
jgi:hypothetical protein